MLDCETPRGKLYINHQRSIQEWLESKDYIVVEFPMKENAIDILIAKRVEGVLQLAGVAEIKARESNGRWPLTIQYLEKNDYLISNDKINNGLLYSSLFNVPFFLIVKLVEEKKILIWNINKTTVRTKKTKTSKSCNGGEYVEVNAFLPLKNALVYDNSQSWPAQ